MDILLLYYQGTSSTCLILFGPSRWDLKHINLGRVHVFTFKTKSVHISTELLLLHLHRFIDLVAWCRQPFQSHSYSPLSTSAGEVDIDSRTQNEARQL